MSISRIVSSVAPRIAPWVAPAVVLIAASALWHGPSTKLPDAKPVPAATDHPSAEPEWATRLVVDFRDDVSKEALDGNGYVEVPVSDYSQQDRVYRMEFPTAHEAAAALAKLSADPTVESADYDAVYTLPPDELDARAAGESLEAECAGAAAPDGAFPNDACFKYQWHLRQVGMPDAWKRGNGKGVVVAVIDTGVSPVADLKETKFVPGYNFLTNSADAADDHGHGTHVAGTIAQATNNRIGVAGVAYGAAIMPLKVLSARGSGSVAGIAQAIRWAADHGAHVINMSLGGPTAIGTMGSAVKYARGKGVVVVAAAGNDGRGRVGYPAAYPGVLAVGATQFDETTTFYSNWGHALDIAAPGGNTRVDQNGDGKPDGVLQHTIVPGDTSRTDYLWFMGTSMASPHAAGVAALVLGAGVRKADAVEEILLDTARKPKVKTKDRNASGRIDDHYGAGIIDAEAALKKAKTGRGAGELGLAAATAAYGIFLMRRRKLAITRLGLGFVAGLVGGAFAQHAADGAVFAMGAASIASPLVWSAVVPLLLTALLYGVRQLRPTLAGLGFGIAGALLFAAASGTVDVRFLPGILDPFWLGTHGIFTAIVAAAVIRKS
jgi:serine protease